LPISKLNEVAAGEHRLLGLVEVRDLRAEIGETLRSDAGHDAAGLALPEVL